MYGSTLTLTSTLYGDGWLTPRPGRFTHVNETRYPLCKMVCGPTTGMDGCGKSRPKPGFDPVASRYTDYAIPSQVQNKEFLNNFCNVPANCALHTCYQHSCDAPVDIFQSTRVKHARRPNNTSHSMPTSR